MKPFPKKSAVINPATTCYLEPVTNVFQTLTMREIRNEVREFMTHNQEKIGLWQQVVWFFRVYNPRRKKGLMQAFLLKDDPLTIGFGLINEKEGKYWVTGGVREVWRGQGYGRFLFSVLTGITLQTEPEVWLDVFRKNVKAANLYRKLGYKSVSPSPERLFVMRKTK